MRKPARRQAGRLLNIVFWSPQVVLDVVVILKLLRSTAALCLYLAKEQISGMRSRIESRGSFCLLFARLCEGVPKVLFLWFY
jgi:hypothetical protein